MYIGVANDLLLGVARLVATPSFMLRAKPSSGNWQKLRLHLKIYKFKNKKECLQRDMIG